MTNAGGSRGTGRHSAALASLCICLSKCPCSKTKMTIAINIKAGREKVHDRPSTSSNLRVKNSSLRSCLIGVRRMGLHVNMTAQKDHYTPCSGNGGERDDNIQLRRQHQRLSHAT